jgi:hypothetical protein
MSVVYLTFSIFHYLGRLKGCVQVEINRSSKHQAGGSPFVTFPLMRIQYIRSHLPCLKAVTSICNMKTRHAVVTATQ